MRKILVVGAGQSGLYLAHSLIKRDGYEVTLITGQTSPEIRGGRASTTQFTLPRTRAWEEDAQLDMWQGTAPRYDRVNMSLRAPGAPAVEFTGRFGNDEHGALGSHGVSVDRRVKMADWLEYFEDCGGKVIIHNITTQDLAYFARMYDLCVVAVGGGELGHLFEPDRTRAAAAYQRVTTQAIMHDVAWASGDRQVDVISSPHGEVFFTPVLTQHGEATSVTITANPGKGLDCSVGPGRVPNDVLLKTMLGKLAEHMPDVYERCRSGVPVDQGAVTQKVITPQLRTPVVQMDDEHFVLATADVALPVDPVSGQEWANSTGCARTFAEAIVEHGDRPFDDVWMRSAFDRFWTSQGQYTERFAQMVQAFWTGQLPEHFQELVGAVMTYPQVANRWIGGFDLPETYDEWMFDPESARAYIAQVAAEAGHS